MGMPAAVDGDRQPAPGRYRFDGELARGGMGVVYRAFDRARGRAIALKRPHAEVEQAAQRRGAELLEREYRALSALRHPRIIEVHDFGHDEQGPFYTMELLDGKDLSAVCPLPWREACSLLRDVASSLALLHARRLIHRDVSPANIRITGQHAKLLDFGTMVQFGRHEQVAGTPSCVAPEVFAHAELDQRVDLFALGATAYYALCGRAAFPATSLKQLPAMWQQHTPLPPSAHVPAIPQALDKLVLSLLALDPLSRPASAGEVIDALRSIAELPGDEDERVVQSYLQSPALVGREEPRSRLMNRLTRMLSGTGGVLLVESALGYGKSALLSELGREGLVRGALVLKVAGRMHREPLSAARALIGSAQLELASTVMGGSRRPPDNENGAPFSEQQLELEAEALSRALSQLSEQRPLLLVVDDADNVDAHSIDVLVRLSRIIPRRHVLIALSADVETAEQQVALRPLRRTAMRVQLSPLTRQDLELLLRTVFGDVPNLKRVTVWLERQTEGSPLLCMELLAELIDQKSIRYADGLWFLPQDLTDDARPSIDKLFERRLMRLSAPARILAGCLSVRRIPTTLEQCHLLARRELPEHDVEQLVLELVEKQVLLSADVEFTFTHGRLQSALYAQLDEPRKQRVHRLLAGQLEPGSARDPAVCAEIGCHLFLAGDHDAAQPYFVALVPLSQDMPLLLRAVPDLLLVQGKHEQQPERSGELSVAVVPLLLAGIYVDPTIFDRLGAPTLDLLEQRAGMRLARRLAPFTGSTLAVLLGLLFGYLRWRMDRGRDKWGRFVYPLAYFGVAARLAGQALFRADRALSQACFERLSSFARLGKHSVVRLVYDCIVGGRAMLAGRYDAALQGAQEMDTYIPYVRQIDSEGKSQFSEMNRFWEGRLRLLTPTPDTLAMAVSLRTSKLTFHWVLAELLRYAYFVSRGELLLAEQARDALDMLVARHGRTWTADLLVALEFPSFHAAGDVVGLKRCLDQLEELITVHPSLAAHLQVARAMYESRRGRPQRALELYEAMAAELEPFESAVWSYAQGHWVECLNAQQRHQEARARSERMLSAAGPLRDEFPVAFIQLARERALALCALAEYDKAAAALDELLERYGSADQPLMVGLLHRDRAVVAAAAAEADTYEQHLRETQQRFVATSNPALIAQVGSLQRLGTLQGVETPALGLASKQRESHLLLNTAEARVLPQASRAERVLEQLLALAGARGARLYGTSGGALALLAQHGADSWSAGLEMQVAELVSLSGDRPTTALSSAAERTARLERLEQLIPVFTSDGDGPRVVAVLALHGAVRLDQLTPSLLTRVATLLDQGPA